MPDSYLLNALFVSKDFKGVFKPHLRKTHFISCKRVIITQQQNAVKLNTVEQFIFKKYK